VQDFLPGQRWISNAEIQMGLGTVLSNDHRTVTILFMATDETRVYARATAPLTRVVFSVGDDVKANEGWRMKISHVEEKDGLILYSGTDEDGGRRELPEGALDHFIKLNRPTERLFSGQLDKNRWFELRQETHLHANRQARNEMLGLTGVRTSLIPHQLYIAHEVANRYAPRVLLADEVGLGKTIEAGMIIHQQLLTERAGRVLIVVPESLIHQWLVEMLRRFNLHFSIFDEARCQAIAGFHSEEEALLGRDAAENGILKHDDDDGHNPFSSEQLVLCSLEFLAAQPDHFQEALSAEWDLLVVDEAHHLEWSPQQSSIEYRCIEQLAAVTRGVLLLTATPEQLGKASHFARLRLLDPDRFPDLDRFVDEEQHYAPVADAVESLLSRQPLSESARATLQTTLNEGDNQPLLDKLNQLGKTSGDNSISEAEIAIRNELTEHLLDRHGTGRVLFRNTRAAIKGFPERQVTGYPLPQPAAYSDCLLELMLDQAVETRQLLCPELAYEMSATGAEWISIDPRVEWLSHQLKALKPARVLVIAADAGSAIALAEALRKRDGIYPALFHEHLSIVERDRAAAYFSDPEYGSPVLICSEIGSEGRNFQFAHHLVLFDLPLNPDLLEQRIGRLDRIGQKNTIQLHVPYMEGTAQETIFRWYHEGLNAFEQTCPAGHNVFTQLMPTLIETLYQVDISDTEGGEDLASLIATTQKVHAELNEALHNGRDQLLEYNSCRPLVAKQLKEAAIENEDSELLADFLTRVFDCYGIESEHHSELCQIIRPGNHMQNSSFPGLHSEGMTITFDRDTALSNEDIHYITWEHPLTTGAMEMLLNNEQGNTAIAAIKHPAIKGGALLLECLFILESSANSALQSNRYLPPTQIRVVIDQQGRDYNNELPSETLREIRAKIDRETTRKIIRAFGKKLREMVPVAEQQAEKLSPVYLAQAKQRSQTMLKREINRLRALQKVNPNVRDDEVRFFEDQMDALTQSLESAHLRLDAVRVIIST